MGRIFLISFCLGLATGHFRGPHHPRSSVSHHHYTPESDAIKLTQDDELLHDATHLKEDMGSMGDQLDFSKMTEQEIEFHYFQIHDVDNNTKLDGLEILHALQHTLHENDEEETVQSDQDWIVVLIDKVLEEDDLNNDGYLEYVEYVLGRQRDHVAQEKRDKLRIGTKKQENKMKEIFTKNRSIALIKNIKTGKAESETESNNWFDIKSQSNNTSNAMNKECMSNSKKPLSNNT